MSIESILNQYGIVTDTPETSRNFAEVSAKFTQNEACTSDTYDSRVNDSIEKIRLPVEQMQKERLQKVLLVLANNPDKQRVYITDDITDQHNVILTVAIRGLASFEMLIPKSKYDPFLMLELINKEHLQ